MARFMKRRHRTVDEDPLTGVANLFDLALVMVLGFMLALLTALKVSDLLSKKSEITIFKRDAKGRIEIIVKKGKEIKIYKGAGKSAQGIVGERIGTAYRLKDGRIVYVPD